MSMKMKPSRDRRAGATLLEVLIASVILIAIVLMAMVVLMNASGAAAKASISGSLENRARMLLERCRSTFMTARFRDPENIVDGLGMHVNNTQVWFQIPSSGSNSGATGWGFSSNLGLSDPQSAGKSCILRFEAETVLRESSAAGTATQPTTVTAADLPALPELDEPDPRDVDLNRDGDLTDTFVVGKLMQYILTEDLEVETTATFDNNIVLAVVGTNIFNGDVDGLASTAAEQDYLFRWVDQDGATVAGQWPGTQSRAVVLSVWHGAWSDDGKMYYMRRGTETIRFKNPQ